MELNEVIITRGIVEGFTRKFLDYLEMDVAIGGGGPAGLVAAYYLARKGKKVAIFERKLSLGGGMWGGGMMFNEIVVQKEGKEILDEFGIKTDHYQEGYFRADSVEAASTICSFAAKAGAKIFNLMSVEDVVIHRERVIGLVLNWSAVEMAKLHVDPLTIKSRYIVDATGHATELVGIIERKVRAKLLTETGKIAGERSLWAEAAEKETIMNTKEAYPGVFVAGMSANATFGGPRMGPIFGGMLLSGKKVAELLIKKLEES